MIYQTDKTGAVKLIDYVGTSQFYGHKRFDQHYRNLTSNLELEYITVKKKRGDNLDLSCGYLTECVSEYLSIAIDAEETKERLDKITKIYNDNDAVGYLNYSEDCGLFAISGRTLSRNVEVKVYKGTKYLDDIGVIGWSGPSDFGTRFGILPAKGEEIKNKYKYVSASNTIVTKILNKEFEEAVLSFIDAEFRSVTKEFEDLEWELKCKRRMAKNLVDTLGLDISEYTPLEMLYIRDIIEKHTGMSHRHNYDTDAWNVLDPDEDGKLVTFGKHMTEQIKIIKDKYKEIDFYSATIIIECIHNITMTEDSGWSTIAAKVKTITDVIDNTSVFLEDPAAFERLCNLSLREVSLDNSSMANDWSKQNAYREIDQMDNHSSRRDVIKLFSSFEQMRNLYS